MQRWQLGRCGLTGRLFARAVRAGALRQESGSARTRRCRHAPVRVHGKTSRPGLRVPGAALSGGTRCARDEGRGRDAGCPGPLHRSVRAEFPHTAPTADVWQRIARSDRDDGSWVEGSTARGSRRYICRWRSARSCGCRSSWSPPQTTARRSPRFAKRSARSILRRRAPPSGDRRPARPGSAQTRHRATHPG